MNVYDLVLGLPWCIAKNPEIDWSYSQLTALQAPHGLQQAKSPEADHTSLPERGVVTKMVSLLWVYNYSGLPQSIISELGRRWSRHLPYDLENVKGCWEHRWKTSPEVRETQDDEWVSRSSGGSSGRRVTQWRRFNNCYWLPETQREKLDNGGGLLQRTVWSSQPRTPAHLHTAKACYNADKANENRNRHS